MLKLAGVERQRGHVVLRFLAGDRASAALGRALVRETVLTKVKPYTLCFYPQPCPDYAPTKLCQRQSDAVHWI